MGNHNDWLSKKGQEICDLNDNLEWIDRINKQLRNFGLEGVSDYIQFNSKLSFAKKSLNLYRELEMGLKKNSTKKRVQEKILETELFIETVTPVASDYLNDLNSLPNPSHRSED